MKKEKSEGKKRHGCLIAVAVVAVVLVVFAAIGGGSTSQTLEYTVGSTSEYARDGEKCVAYRVTTEEDTTDENLLSIYNDVTDDDYYLHTVYFYSSADMIDGGDAYDVAVLEETEEGETPEITRAETAESNELIDHVELYDYWGTEPYSENESINIAYWWVYFDEDCDTKDYDYKDFIPVMAECVAREENEQDGADKYSILGLNSDSLTVFSWDQQTDAYHVYQTDWYYDDTHKTWEWVLTSDDVNEILGK